ncbi:MAG: hypothetical protein FJX01_02335 [Alphaproteobacteria bacterium]|nr:hypothetical protein [Alphaproteobacteria bacterium]
MRSFNLIIFFIFVSNCSLNNDFQFSNKNKEERNKSAELYNILEKKNDITKMTFEEYKIYLDDYTKRNEYPSLNK